MNRIKSMKGKRVKGEEGKGKRERKENKSVKISPFHHLPFSPVFILSILSIPVKIFMERKMIDGA
jgi:hypothetical protein